MTSFRVGGIQSIPAKAWIWRNLSWRFFTNVDCPAPFFSFRHDHLCKTSARCFFLLNISETFSVVNIFQEAIASRGTAWFWISPILSRHCHPSPIWRPSPLGVFCRERRGGFQRDFGSATFLDRKTRWIRQTTGSTTLCHVILQVFRC